MRDARARIAWWLRWAGAVGIAVVAALRVTTLFAPRVVFDIDPALAAGTIGGLGPAGSLWLDVALLALCAAALAGEVLARRGTDLVVLGLALVPLPIVLWHGASDAGDLWRGATWAAGALACATTAHLARDASLRRLLIALLVAVLATLFVRGAANVTYEHADTIAQYQAQKEQLLADRGWAPDSSSALIYERRLRQRQPTGWFVTTNVYGSFMACGLVLFAGLAIAAVRAHLPSGWSGLFVLGAAASAGALLMTSSKGAVLAAILGLIVLVAPLAAPLAARAARRWGPVLAVGLVALTLLGVVMRGAALPESFAGERSLLFRWHYLVSSAQIVQEAPLLGVGPDGYQAAYMRHRLPRNPEEVTSVHSVFVDWVSCLGVAGAAWIALVLLALWRAGGALRPGALQEIEGPERGPPWWWWGTIVVVVVVLGLVPATLIEARALDDLALVVRTLGIAAYVVAAAGLACMLPRVDRGLVAWALAVAALVLVVHGQIEMTFARPAAVVWVMTMIGIAAPAAGAAPREGSRPPWGIAAAVLAIATSLWLLVTGAVPASREQRLMIDAAAVLWPLAGSSDVRPADEVAARAQAVELLREAQGAMPTDDAPMLAAADQHERTAARVTEADRAAPLERVLACVDDLVERGEGPAMVTAARAHHQLALLTGDPGHAQQAIALARRLTEADPNGLQTWRRLADLLWELGERADAALVYERVLEIDDDFALDPLKQLPARDRVLVEERLRSEGDR